MTECPKNFVTGPDFFQVGQIWVIGSDRFLLVIPYPLVGPQPNLINLKFFLDPLTQRAHASDSKTSGSSCIQYELHIYSRHIPCKLGLFALLNWQCH